MGLRMHVCTKYEIEYSETANFSFEAKGIKQMLSDAGAEVILNSDNDDFSDWTVDAKDFKKAVENIKEWDEETILDYITHWSREYYSKEDIVNTLDAFVKSGVADKYGDMHFHWF